MPSAIASLSKQIADLKAQSLSTLMASIDPVQAIARVGGNLTGNVEASLQSVEAAIRAVILDVQPSGRALLQIAGGMIEADLPPDLMRAAQTNPNLIKPGNTLTLPADIPARAVPDPATRVAMSGVTTSGHAFGASVGPAPPLPSVFPAGTLGAAIARLAGITFPQAEPQAALVAGAPLSPGLRPGSPGHSTPTPTPTLPPQLAAAVLQAASRQVPLATALTQLLSVQQMAMAPIPAALAVAIRDLQLARSTTTALQTTNGLRQAVMTSGLFLEANLAQAAPGQAVPADLKSILLAIRALAGDETLPEVAARTSAPSTPTPERAPVAGEATQPRNPPEIGRLAEGAIERLKLMQLASMPDHPELTVTDDRAQSSRLALSIPIATQGVDRPQTAVMGLVIEHQPQHEPVAPYETEAESEGESEPFPWKIRLALDLEETGPVQVEIGLRGQSIAVTLWAERQSMARLARDEIGTLHDALTGAAFDVTKLEVRDGRPLGKAPSASPLLDRRT